MRKLKIAQIAPLWERVPPEKYGGAEGVIYNLSNGLVKRGHKVTLFATGDSKSRAHLKSVYPRALYRDKISWDDPGLQLLNLSSAYQLADQFDILHGHISTDYYGLYFAKLVKTPSVFTLHNAFPKPGTKYAHYLYKHFGHLNYISVSDAFQKNFSVIKYLDRVYNGIDIDRFKFFDKPSNYLFWIGRFADGKGTREAILVAKKLRMKLYLAGKMDHVDQKYIDQVKPLIDGKQIIYVGELNEREKIRYYQKALALLVPIKWEEPFGLVMPEAMSCGTPVVAFRRGSAPEIVKQGYSGFLVPPGNVDAMAKAVLRIDQIKRKNCRQWVEDKFSIEKMVDGYEDVYQKILERRK